MTKFENGKTYLAKGNHANDGKTKEVVVAGNSDGKITFKDDRWLAVIETDDVGEYAWISAVWCVHSKDEV